MPRIGIVKHMQYSWLYYQLEISCSKISTSFWNQLKYEPFRSEKPGIEISGTSVHTLGKLRLRQTIIDANDDIIHYKLSDTRNTSNEAEIVKEQIWV